MLSAGVLSLLEEMISKTSSYVGGINGILCLDWMGDYIFLGGRGR